MNIKRFLLINSMVLSLLGASMASAQSVVNNAATTKTGHYHQHIDKMLTPEQRTELLKIRKGLRAQMIPLIKERRALSMQIRGKIANPNAKWSDISALVEKRNVINDKMSSLWAKTQFKTFQKLGILLPVHKHHRHYSK